MGSRARWSLCSSPRPRNPFFFLSLRKTLGLTPANRFFFVFFRISSLRVSLRFDCLYLPDLPFFPPPPRCQPGSSDSSTPIPSNLGGAFSFLSPLPIPTAQVSFFFFFSPPSHTGLIFEALHLGSLHWVASTGPVATAPFVSSSTCLFLRRRPKRAFFFLLVFRPLGYKYDPPFYYGTSRLHPLLVVFVWISCFGNLRLLPAPLTDT